MQLMKPGVRHAAIYLGADGIYADGFPMSDAAPAGLVVGDIAHTLDMILPSLMDDGVILINAPDFEVWAAERQASMAERGWRLPSPPAAWTTVKRNSRADSSERTVTVGCLPSIALRPWPADCSPAGVTAWLQDSRLLWGVPWRMRPGVTAHAVIRSHFREEGRRIRPLWHYSGVPGRPDLRAGAGGLVWAADQLPMGTVAVDSWDIAAAHLGSWSTAWLATGELEPVGPDAPFDRESAGFWLIDWDPAAWVHPCPPPLPHQPAGPVCVTTPIVAVLHDAGVKPRILDAALAPMGESRRLLADVAGVVSRAREMGRASDTLAAATKNLYAHGTGMLGRTGGSIHRPDWMWTIVDQTTANVVRKMLYIGARQNRWPCAVLTDAIYYPVYEDTPEPPHVVERPRANLRGPRPVGRLVYKGRETPEAHERRVKRIRTALGLGHSGA